jgi:RNA polymerase sigma-70 factor (ECF subfamily)
LKNQERGGIMIESLIERAMKNDLQAFEEIIKLYEKKVYNLALRYVKNHDDALDVAQDVFILVYNNLSSFRGESAFSTWIYRITYNNCVDMLRRKSKKSSGYSIDDDDNFIKLPSNDVSIEQEYENKEKVKSVMEAIDKLPKEQRDIIILRSIKELSYSEIGEILNIAEGTVKSRLNRARLKIKEIMKEKGT